MKVMVYIRCVGLTKSTPSTTSTQFAQRHSNYRQINPRLLESSPQGHHVRRTCSSNRRTSRLRWLHAESIVTEIIVRSVAYMQP